MSLIEDITLNRDKFTKTDHLIASYISQNVLEFTLKTIGMVAEDLQISTTSLIRFAKKMGFDGYIGLRKKLQDEEVIRHSSAERYKSLLPSRSHKIADNLRSKEIDSIQQSFEGMDIRKLDELIKMISKGRNIFCAGRDVASLLAEVLTIRMRNYGYPCIHLDMDKYSYQRQLIFSNPEDVLIVFDYPEYSTYINDLVRFAHEKSLTIAVVTDYATCPLVKYADYIFYCDSQTDLFNDSMIAPMFFINLLISMLLYYDEDHMVEYLKRKEELKDFER
ncbi:MAG: MurR/RpiR family transcriptional regulator [Bacteroidales bacterium]|nr:MurR/RpiR family transcriptional regulator [Bacteroidales bacterium]